MRCPHPLFDPDYYLANNPDVAASGDDPFVHFMQHGAFEGRKPNPFFDPKYYLNKYPDVAAANDNPLVHYVTHGAAEGRDPSPLFDTDWYLAQNPDVAASGTNPLSHYLEYGQFEGRAPAPTQQGQPRDPQPIPHKSPATRSDECPSGISRLIERYESAEELTPATLLRLAADKLDVPLHFFLPHNPINVFVDLRLSSSPALNMFLPSVQMRHATGGPNVAYMLVTLLAKKGFRIRIFSTDIPPDDDISRIKTHISQLTGDHPDHVGITFVDASDRNRAVPIGYNDLILATAWWTAHPAHSISKFLRNKRIYYLIQDYEPLFYAASENFADAEATYSFDHYPIISGSLLRDHLSSRGVGRFADAAFAESAAIIESAVDRTCFYPEPRKPDKPRRVLFYARPTIGRRNLFGLGVAALRASVQLGLFGDGWEFLGMGEPFTAVPLGRGYELRPAPWLDFNAYAGQMREADLLLSLMLSPHPSFPPLEMAACGGITVTTTFGSKTAARLREFSSSIIGVPAQLDDIVGALSAAVSQSDDDNQRALRARELTLAGSWSESLSAILPSLLKEFKRDGLVPAHEAPQLREPVGFVKCDVEVEGSPEFYIKQTKQRRRLYRSSPGSTSLSVITPAHNTDPEHLSDLANSVLSQDTNQEFEWLILDNGSSSRETVALLDQLKLHPRVRLERSSKNLGIIGGTRWCLESARGTYIVPLDHDDLLFPDALRVLGSYLEQAGLPALVYTDEDKTEGNRHRDAYIKPEWDPVLFFHSCYIAHLTAIHRLTALKLGCYTDSNAEGSPDYDAFTRFVIAGYKPLRIPEIVYSWRMHPASTSANYHSKPYVYDSQRAVLQRFLNGRQMHEDYEVVLSPIFGGSPDWRFRPRTTESDSKRFKSVTVRIAEVVSPSELLNAVSNIPDAPYVQLIGPDCEVIGELATEEASALFDLFPETVMIGGRIHDNSSILESGYVFGYGRGVGSPDFRRPIGDPGYFTQMWKARTVAAASARFCFVEREFLISSLRLLPERLSLSAFGPWLGALACRAGQRVIYSPFVEAKCGRVSPIGEHEQALFNAEFGDLAAESVGYPCQLDRSGNAPYLPAANPPLHALLPYEQYLGWRMRHRMQKVWLSAKGVPRISLLSLVYEKTNPELFQRTAESVRSQTLRPFEWLVLINGPIADELEALLANFAKERLVTILRKSEHLGICRGLRYCLEHASGEFAVWLDHDDLLTPDCISLLAQAVIEHPEAAIFYTDEDIIAGTQPRDPYYRPDFDPALLLSHSYIWHAILFQRDVAMKLGAFTSVETQYALDWDISVRFLLGGYEAVHVPEVTYHWRQHPDSFSNSGVINEGTLRSVQAILSFIKDRSHDPDLYEVAPYPIDTGIPDFYLKRRATLPISTHVIFLNEPVTIVDFPYSSNTISEARRGNDGLEALSKSVEASDAELVAVVSSALFSVSGDGLWQTLKHFELIPNCVAVSGPLISKDGRVLFGTPVPFNGKKLIDPILGKPVRYQGNFSIAVKPHSITAIPIDCFVARRDFLVRALSDAPKGLALRSLGVWLGACAQLGQVILVYEPLLKAHVSREIDLIGDGIEGLNIAWQNLILPRSDSNRQTPIRGLAAFAIHNMHHQGP